MTAMQLILMNCVKGETYSDREQMLMNLHNAVANLLPGD